MGSHSEGRIDEVIDRLNRERAAEAGKMQCKVCWWVYDPEKAWMKPILGQASPLTNCLTSLPAPCVETAESLFYLSQIRKQVFNG